MDQMNYRACKRRNDRRAYRHFFGQSQLTNRVDTVLSGRAFEFLRKATAFLGGKARGRLQARLIAFCDHFPNGESINALREYFIARGRLSSDDGRSNGKTPLASRNSPETVLGRSRKLKRCRADDV
jgi:hypothetical protein